MDITGWVVALATVVLVVVTTVYVALTYKLAKAAEEQIRLDKTPNLIFGVSANGDLEIANLGRHTLFWIP